MDDMDAEDRLELAELRADVKNLITTVNEVKAKLNSFTTTHVSIEGWTALKDRVALLEKIAFGTIGVVVVAVLGALIALVIKR